MFPFSRPQPARCLAVLLVCVLTFAAGCQSLSLGGSTPRVEGENLRRILASGELRVAMTGTQPPLNMKNKRGELIGLDVELARSLADSMGLELVLVETVFADLLSDLEAGKVDLVISSLTITPARNARVAFAGPYLISGATLLTNPELIEEVDDPADLNSANRSFAALEGSTGEAFILAAFPLARLVAIDDQSAAVAQIRSGEIDGLVADLPFVRYEVSRSEDGALRSWRAPFTTEPLGIALPPNAPLFANLVQNYLNTLEYTGQLIQMKARWLNAGDWLMEMP